MLAVPLLACPGGHATQRVCICIVPSLQAIHPFVPSGMYPDWHVSHKDWPALVLTDPAGQTEHALLPVVETNVPLAQRVH